MTSKRTPSDKKERSREGKARYAYPGLDRVLHERARLGILASMAAHPQGLTFGELKELCDLTDGNLSRHVQLLAEHNLIETDRHSGAGRPQSTYRLTDAGRQRFVDYVEQLEQVVSDAAGSRSSAAISLGRKTSPAG